MKVFINFNDVRCCVPVGDGSLTVKQVILLAIERYKKATSKDSNWHIIVHTLKTIRDGAILDPDDSLFDVADDREQLIAVFDEHHNNNNDNNYGNDRNAAVADAANLNKGPQLPSNNSNMSAKLANNHRNYMNIAQSNYHHHHHHNKSNSLHSYDPRQQQQHQPNLNENVYGRVKKIPQQQQQQVLHPHPIPPLSSITPGKRNTNPFSINQPPYQHFHSGSMSDSLISGSNDSPSISLIHHSNSYHEQRNPIQQPNRVSIEVMDTRQTSIAIHNAARRSLPYHHEDGLPSSIYEPKFNHSSITTTNAYTSDMESSNEFGDDSLEITVDDINSHTNIPLSLHVRHGSEPNISHNDVGRSRITSEHHDNNEQNNQNLIVIDNDQSISDIDVGGGARVANIINQYKSNDLDSMQAKHNTNNNSNQKHQRWSTAIAIEQNNGSSRLIDATNKKSQLVSNYEHSDEEKSFNSISPQSTKEEGYGSEEQSQNSQSESIIITPHPTSPTIPDGGGGLSSPQMFNHVTQTFARGSGRLSMLNNNLDQWADAADRQLIKIRQNNQQQQQPEQEKSLTTGSTTTSAAAASTTTATTTNSLKPPNSYLQTQTIDKNFHRPNHHQQLTLCDSSLGSMSNSSQENEHHSIANLPAATSIAGRFYLNQPKKSNLLSVIIDLSKERGGPLGIHILSDNGPNLNQGLLIHGIEPGGRIDRDGRLNVGDIIVELDDKSFAGIQYEKAQEIFRSSLDNDCIKLLIQKSSLNYCDNSPNLNVNVNNSNNEQEDEENKENQQLVEGVEERIVAGQLAKMAQVTPTKKLPSPGVSNLIGYKPATSAIVIANTRRIGKKYHIQLKKEEHGLGFTITTRDNPAGGLSPIYIKTILPRGAAVQDGRLKPGDRLLEVCGIEMTGKSQEEAVKILRNLPSDSIVDLIVSRQEVEVSPSPLMPRQLPPEATNEPNCSSNKEREVLTFQILLNDTGSAGLGISVKGKTSNADGHQQDSGIFIKSVLHGGAASKDGRLKQDDQLININGIPLSGKTNSEAMETLTRATIKSAHQITLTIARRTCHSPSHRNDDNDDNNNIPYRHQQEMSILSTDSYDMSFTTNNNNHNHNNTTNGNNQSNDGQNRLYNDSQYSHEDSFRSSENTVIYNVSQKQNFINTAVNESKNSIMDNHRSMVNKFSTNDSQSSSSLNDDQQLQLQQRKQSIDVGGGGGGGGGVVDDGDRFRRDGFGRQSMSEKRHAQLDAKTTDTYRRSKKNKDHQPHQQQTTGNNQNDNNGDDGGNVGDDERIESNRIDTTTVVRYGEDGNQNGNLHHNDHHRPAYDRDNVELKTPATVRGGSVLTSDKKVKSSQTKNQILFSPVCCWKCQSPGSCPCRSKSELSAEIYNSRMNGYPVDNKMIMMKQQHQKQGSNSASSKAEAVLMPPPPFIIRKSCSLESLQTMMQDLQKEQLEQVGGSNVHGDDSGYHTARHATTIARIGKSVPNESFRAAVDRSYNIKNYLPHSSQIQSVTEEGDDETTTASRTSTCPYRVGGGHSMTSTNYTIETTTATATTNADDNARLLKTNGKKKKNFIKTLFHFGSRKGRSKSMEPGSHKKSDDLRLQSSNEMKMFPKDYDDNLKYRLEQERIRYQYDKLIEEEKQKKQQQQQQPEYQQQQQFVRNPSHPMHQSMPLSNSHRSRAGISPRNQTTNSTTNTNRLQQQQQQVYMSNYTPSPRDTVGVPQVMRNEKSNLRPHHHQHRVHPETTSDDYSNRFGDLKNQIHPPVESGNARHLQINSHDFYGRITSSNRPENQPVLEANINHSNYGVPYSNANNNANKMFGQNTQRHYGTASRTMVTNLDQAEKNIHHYRQLSLRQPQQQHQRQISSPATGQNFYQFQQRSVLNYYGEQQKSPPSGTATTIVPRNYTTNHLNQTRSYQTTPTTNQYGPSIQQQKNETIYGIVGQQHQSQQQQMRTNHNHQQQQQTILGPNVMFRQQQPIYQTNQLQIYGTVYNNNNNPNMNSGNSNHTVNNPHHHHQTSGHYDLKPHSNHSQNGLPYAYSSIVGSNQ